MDFDFSRLIVIELVKNDVRPFIKNAAEMEIWSANYFLQLVDMMRVE